MFKRVQQSASQTDGTRCVVSSCTVFNGDRYHEYWLLSAVVLRLSTAWQYSIATGKAQFLRGGDRAHLLFKVDVVRF